MSLLQSGAAPDDALEAQKMTSSEATAGDTDGNGADDISASQKMLSAISGSLLTALLVTPLDVVRVRLQSQGSSQPRQTTDIRKTLASTASCNAFRPTNLGVTACCREVFFANNNGALCLAGPKIQSLRGPGATPDPRNCAIDHSKRRDIHSTLDGIRKIARHEGFTSLWRGLSPTLVMAIPANIIYFTGYDWLRSNPASPIATGIKSDVYAPLVSGSVARILAATVVSPIDLFRTRLQASPGSTATGHLANTFEGVKEMVAHHGYRSLWRGLSLTLWRDVPFSGLYWWGYETIRGKLTDIRDHHRGRPRSSEAGSRSRERTRSQSREKHVATFIDSFAAGALSGTAASLVTMPFDVGKTRTQVYKDSTRKVAGGMVDKATLAPEARSMSRLLWHILTMEGIAGLWKGWIPRTLKVAPSCAIMISSYEVGKRTFRSMNERSTKKRKHGDERDGI